MTTCRKACSCSDGETCVHNEYGPLCMQTTMAAERKWEVVHDGPSLPMIQAPTGEIYRIQELGTGTKGCGAWGQNRDGNIENQVVAALNHAQRD